jgi:hypothetical protein
MIFLAVNGRLRPVEHPVIPYDVCNPQMVILKDIFPALGLGHTMYLKVSPMPDSLLIAPERERQDFIGLGQALKTFDGNEPVDLYQLRL